MQELLYDWQVWAYFAVLAWALQKQLKRASLSSISVAAALVAVTLPASPPLVQDDVSVSFDELPPHLAQVIGKKVVIPMQQGGGYGVVACIQDGICEVAVQGSDPEEFVTSYIDVSMFCTNFMAAQPEPSTTSVARSSSRPFPGVQSPRARRSRAKDGHVDAIVDRADVAHLERVSRGELALAVRGPARVGLELFPHERARRGASTSRNTVNTCLLYTSPSPRDRG